jgi:hypothetical protein
MEPGWEALQHVLAGEVLLPGSDGFACARPPFEAWFDSPQPQAVARCAAAEDVAEVIGFARRSGLAIAIR